MVQVNWEQPADQAPVNQRRYTDRDVNADFARLHTIATRYLLTYSGTFDPLRAARSVVESGQLLTVPQLRIVCNTIIQDFRVQNMPEPKGHLEVFDAAEHDREVIDITTRKPVRKTRPRWIKLKASVNPNRPYWYSTLRSACVVHVGFSIEVEYRTELYYDERDWYVLAPPFHERFFLIPRAMCKSWYSWPRGMRSASKEEATALIGKGRYWCPACANAAAKRGIVL